jgi:hypothetical protein
MYSRSFVAAMAVASLAALAACVTHDGAAPRVSQQEMQVLVSDYYWHRNLPLPHYSPEQLDQLLRASADPTLDGERAESQASRVAVALASVGDDSFSQALSHQPASVKRAVAREIHYMWTQHHLHYPKTQRVLQPYI